MTVPFSKSWFLAVVLICSSCTGGTSDADADGNGIQPPTEDRSFSEDGVVDGGVDQNPPQDLDTHCMEPGFLPPALSPDPPTADSTCNYMDWRLEPDGHYYISMFWIEPGEGSGGTSCNGLGLHYLTWCCQFDRHLNNEQGDCIDGQQPDFQGCDLGDARLPKIPWVTGSVLYHQSDLEDAVDQYFFNGDGSIKPSDQTMDFPHPEYFYVAGAQRFNCGSVLRLTNTENGRCIVVYSEDGGPGALYEQADKGKRRIIDSSPAVVRYLEPSKVGWARSTMLRVEWGSADDRPGQPCVPCQRPLAEQGSESMRTSFDVNHADSHNCRVKVGP